jgi:predicted esterase
MKVDIDDKPRLDPEEFPGPGDHLLWVETTSDQVLQPRRLFVPSSPSNNLPLLVVLHGMGVDHNAWFDLTPVKAAAEKYGVVLAAPLGRGNWFYRGAAEQDVLDIVGVLSHSGQIDCNRIYIAGHSMGGWGTWWIGLCHPDLFAGICPMSGFAPAYLLANAGHFDPFIIHAADDDVVPVKYSRMPSQLLAKQKLAFHYREETGYGHASSLIGDNLNRIFERFLRAERVSCPRRISLAARTPSRGRGWWLAMVELMQFGSVAALDATMVTAEQIQVNCINIKSFAINASGLGEVRGSSIRVVCNGVLAETMRMGGGWHCFENAGAMWNLKGIVALRPEPVLPRWHIEVPRCFPGYEHNDEAYDIVSKILADGVGADAVVLPADSLLAPYGTLSAEAALDVYIRPDENLGVFPWPTATLAQIESLSVLTPLRVWRRPTVSNNIMPNTLVVAPWEIAFRIHPLAELAHRSLPELFVQHGGRINPS